ncbi:protein obstructor-E [Eurytemora carolleeae]|uniref:protein obstructor-E n=1 Tax=Eurytemora carolleeae TaxID=1294199 RepID=UPI000C76345B|nr:protein obstructor-E [Eurytemora carolleeae]|eukprot:XP_023319940.1 protein obstructor-E-like [Eurytemora affinis]
MKMLLNLMVLVVGGVVYGQETGQRVGSGLGEGQGAQIAASQEYDYILECPEEDGFFADTLQCDKYYECVDGVATEKLCADGLVFDESSKKFAICKLPAGNDCKDRPEQQEPIPSENCPRQNGYYPDPDPAVCDSFFFCTEGKANPLTCSSGLVFDPSLGSCGWKDAVKRVGCEAKDKAKSGCPDKGGSPHEYTRYANPDDCESFFLCIGGITRPSGCEKGKVFDPETFTCERPSKVEGPCKDWFKNKNTGEETSDSEEYDE